jgi:16S rRNA (uracil1498-N3)-methyltransferase
MANRYFLDPLPGGGRIHLDGDLAHHLGRVLRVRPGDEVALGDGRGGAAVARVLAALRDRIEVEITAATHAPAPVGRVQIAFAAPQKARAEWLFEHGTEVGIDDFLPVLTERVRPAGDRVDRWRKLVAAAAGQCDRLWWPTVAPPRDLAALLAGPLPTHRYLAAAGAPPLPAVGPAADDVLLLVGPEGGFADHEVAAVRAAGFAPCGLGPHTLRTETAALAGAALLVAGRAR